MYVVEDKVVFIHVKPGKLGLYIHLFILGIVFDFFFALLSVYSSEFHS